MGKFKTIKWIIKQTNSGRVFVAKNRNGIDGVVFPIYMDTKNVNIEVLKMEAQKSKEASAESNRKALREKYKEFNEGENK